MTPAAVLVDLLRCARDTGTAFAEAWDVALVEALAVEPDGASEWEAALTDTREAWSAAFGREDAPARERALLLVGADRDTPIRPTCRHCAADLPAGGDPRRRYRSARCRRAFSDLARAA